MQVYGWSWNQVETNAIAQTLQNLVFTRKTEFSQTKKKESTSQFYYYIQGNPNQRVPQM
jgi:hypothetical protein